MVNSNLENHINYEKKYENIKIALWIFVICKILIYQTVSSSHETKYVFLISIVFLAAFLAEMCFCFVTKKHNKSYNHKNYLNNYTQITALIICCFINFGYHALIVFASTFLCIFFIKKLFGDFKYNIFNTPAACMILIYNFDPYMVNVSSMDTPLDRVFLSLFNTQNSTHISQINNLKNAIFSEKLPYISNITIILLILTILYFLIITKFIKQNISMPLIILLFLFILSFSFIGFLNGTAHLKTNILQFSGVLRYIITLSGSIGHIFKTLFLLIYILIGPTILAIFLCTSYTSSIPKNTSGKFIVGFFIAFCIFYTKIFTNNSFGVFYSIIIANGFTPMINNVFNVSKNKEHAIIISLILLSLLIGFITFSFAMKGV